MGRGVQNLVARAGDGLAEGGRAHIHVAGHFSACGRDGGPRLGCGVRDGLAVFVQRGLQDFIGGGQIQAGDPDGFVESVDAGFKQRRDIGARLRQLIARDQEDVLHLLDVVCEGVLDFGARHGQVGAGAAGQFLQLAVARDEQFLEVPVVIAQRLGGSMEDLGRAVRALADHDGNVLAGGVQRVRQALASALGQIFQLAVAGVEERFKVSVVLDERLGGGFEDLRRIAGALGEHGRNALA